MVKTVIVRRFLPGSRKRRIFVWHWSGLVLESRIRRTFGRRLIVCCKQTVVLPLQGGSAAFLCGACRTSCIEPELRSRSRVQGHTKQCPPLLRRFFGRGSAAFLRAADPAWCRNLGTGTAFHGRTRTKGVCSPRRINIGGLLSAALPARGSAAPLRGARRRQVKPGCCGPGGGVRYRVLAAVMLAVRGGQFWRLCEHFAGTVRTAAERALWKLGPSWAKPAPCPSHRKPCWPKPNAMWRKANSGSPANRPSSRTWSGSNTMRRPPGSGPCWRQWKAPSARCGSIWKKTGMKRRGKSGPRGFHNRRFCD